MNFQALEFSITYPKNLHTIGLHLRARVEAHSTHCNLMSNNNTANA